MTQEIDDQDQEQEQEVKPKRLTAAQANMPKPLRRPANILGESRRIEEPYREPKPKRNLQGYAINGLIAVILAAVMIFVMAPSKSSITTLQSNIDALGPSLTSQLDTKLKAFDPKIATLETTLKGLQDSVTALNPQLKSLSTELSTRATMSETDSKIKQLTELINSKVSQLTTSVESLESIKGTLSNNQKAIDTVSLELDKLKIIVASIGTANTTPTTTTGKITVALKTFTDTLTTSNTTPTSYSLKLTLANSGNTTISDIKAVITFVSNYSGTLTGTLATSSESTLVFTRIPSYGGFLQFSNASWGLNLGPLETKTIYLTLFLNQTTVPVQLVLDSVTANPL